MGSIYTRHVYQFSMELLGGKIYIFNNFEKWRAGKRCKISDHSFLIRLNGNSTITHVSEESVLINYEKYRLCDYDQLIKIADKNLFYDRNYLILKQKTFQMHLFPNPNPSVSKCK